ncbi:MAG: hypothetical protein H0V53_14580, partial [Rubrobacter sp.]|nr:hypothetical protein [Rubrobacter sp.]
MLPCEVFMGFWIDTLLEIFLTAALGAVDLWLGLPAGLAVGLPPVVAGAAATVGGVLGVLILVKAGGRLQRWVEERGLFSKRRKRVERLWNRYGVPGMALQAPMLTGAPLATIISLGLG